MERDYNLLNLHEASTLLIRKKHRSPWMRYMKNWSFTARYDLYLGEETYASLIYESGNLDGRIETAKGVKYIKGSEYCFSKITGADDDYLGKVNEKGLFGAKYVYRSKTGQKLIFHGPGVLYVNDYICLNQHNVQLFRLNCSLLKGPLSVSISELGIDPEELLLLVLIAVDIKVMKHRQEALLV